MILIILVLGSPPLIANFSKWVLQIFLVFINWYLSLLLVSPKGLVTYSIEVFDCPPPPRVGSPFLGAYHVF